jgi:formiminotetrahydrofolate cyclodeaminase
MRDSSSPKRLSDLTIDEFLTAVAADTPAPGGGSVAALAGALGAALAAMVAGLTVGRERHAAHDAQMRTLLAQASALRQELVALMDADTAAYTEVMTAYKLPKDTEAQRAERAETIQAALRGAAETPLAAAAACADVLRLTVQAATHGNRNAASDAAVSALMAHAGLLGAARNVLINLKSIDDAAFCRAAEMRIAELLRAGEHALAAALAAADARG